MDRSWIQTRVEVILRGEGVRYGALSVPRDKYDRLVSLVQKNQATLKELFLDPDGIQEAARILGLGRSITNWEGLIPDKTSIGLEVGPDSWIEVKKGRKRRRIPSPDILEEETSILPFQKEEQKAYSSDPQNNNVTIILGERMVGRVGKWQGWAGLNGIGDWVFLFERMIGESQVLIGCRDDEGEKQPGEDDCLVRGYFLERTKDER